MLRALVLGCLAMTAIASLGRTPVAAESPAPTFTTIVVGDMHCSACAKKIAAKLYLLPGVLEVRADVANDTAYVVPQKQKSIPPKAMWEAVESAGFDITLMSGPGGKFTRKPKQ